MKQVFSADKYLEHLHLAGIYTIPAHLVIETWELDGQYKLYNVSGDACMVEDQRGNLHARCAADFVPFDAWTPCHFEFEPAPHGYIFSRRLKHGN